MAECWFPRAERAFRPLRLRQISTTEYHASKTTEGVCVAWHKSHKDFVKMRRCCGREVLFRRAAQMLLEPLHQCGIGALAIGGSGALEPVSRAFDSNERRGHARFRQRSVHRRVTEEPCTATLQGERD